MKEQQIRKIGLWRVPSTAFAGMRFFDGIFSLESIHQAISLAQEL